MKLTNFAIIIICFLTTTLHAQEVISTAGSQGETTSGSLNWTVGEAVIETITNGTNTPLNPITSANIRVRKIEQEDESRIDLRQRMWLSEADFDAGRRDIWVNEIPLVMQNLYDNYTPAQFANADNGQLQNSLKNMFEDGDSNSRFQELFPTVIWSGLGNGTVTVIMPS